MSNAPQNQNPKDQYSSQGKPAQAGNNPKKDEPTSEKRAGGMKDEACSTTGNKSSDCGTKSSKA